MRKIAIVGFKGGIGKTTTCVNLGAALALQGYRVLLIDTDTQANVATALGVTGKVKKTLADVLNRKISAEEAIIQARHNLDLLPGSLDLFKAQQRMVLEMAREEIFEELFAGLQNYDYHLVDCAPSLSLLTINTIVYVDEVFIPVSMESLAAMGAEQFKTYLQSIVQRLGRGAQLKLVIPTMYDPRRRISGHTVKLLRDLGPRLTEPIWIDTKLSEAPGVGQTIFEYDKNSRAAGDYNRLADTVMKMSPPINTNNTNPTPSQETESKRGSQ
jgi:chromosome partitioning protein